MNAQTRAAIVARVARRLKTRYMPRFTFGNNLPGTNIPKVEGHSLTLLSLLSLSEFACPRVH